MKRLSLLLLALVVVTSAVVAKQDVDTTIEQTTQKRQNGRKMTKESRTKKVSKSENPRESEAYMTETYSRGGVRGGCATGSCRPHHREHACSTHGCGVCHQAAIPPQPLCTKAVQVTESPCLHKQTYYSWTCPVGTTLEERGNGNDCY